MRDREIDATPGSAAIQAFDGDKLHVRGKKIGCIEWQFEPFLPTAQHYDERDNPIHLNNIRRMYDVLEHYARCPGIGSTRELNPHILVDQLDLPEVKPGVGTEERFRRWIRQVRKNGNKPELVLAWLQLQSNRQTLIDCIEICNTLATKRISLFETQTSSVKVFGVCSFSAITGDELFLVSGVGMPLLLRYEASGGYRLISPARVNGLMKGELWINVDVDTLDRIVII